jgi:uncharacterized membrane protein YesL
MAVLRVYWRSLKHLYLRGYIYVWANLLWVALSIPIITAPAAWAGLVHVSYKAQTQPTVSLEDFWEGFKANLPRDTLIGLLTALVLFVNYSNLYAYPFNGEVTRTLLNVVWFSAMLLTISLYFYLWVILEQMVTPTLLGGIFNALLMVLKNPFFTLGILLGIVVIMGISTVLFPLWFLLTGSSIAVLTTTAVLDRLHIIHDDPLTSTNDRM